MIIRPQCVVRIESVPPRWPFVGAMLDIVFARGVIELAVIGAYLWWR